MNSISLENKAVCFTGHRPDKVGGYDEANEIAEKVKSFLRAEIIKLKAEGYLAFISGMALGIDQWAAEIVLEDPELTLIAAVPCKGQESKWPESSRARYNEIIKRAHRIHYVAESYAPWVMQERNKFMVDKSEIVVAVWDGSSGGTANCVKYAKAQEKEIRQFNPRSIV